jgi:hypothetical protein
MLEQAKFTFIHVCYRQLNVQYASDCKVHVIYSREKNRETCLHFINLCLLYVLDRFVLYGMRIDKSNLLTINHFLYDTVIWNSKYQNSAEGHYKNFDEGKLVGLFYY